MSKVCKTAQGTPYLRDPEAVCVAATTPDFNADVMTFLQDYDTEFGSGLEDYVRAEMSTDDPAVLSMFAGQLCYLAFGHKRTPIENIHQYMANILVSGHGSVLEHVNFSYLLYGIDRATTHELVRHRVGFAVSQVSQRYVNADRVRFVLPWEDRDEEGMKLFERHIDRAAQEYEDRTEYLMRKFPRQEHETATDHRKRIQSSARSVLPNDTEAPCVVTINARSARHMIALRTSPKADVRIRRPFIQILRDLQERSPALFRDFELQLLPDGSFGASTSYPKP